MWSSCVCVGGKNTLSIYGVSLTMSLFECTIRDAAIGAMWLL